MGTRRRHGAQNAHDTPSKQTLENEFGTQNEDEVLVKILEGGIVQETEVGFLILFSPRSLVLLPYCFSPQSTTACVRKFQPRSCKHRCGERVKANNFHSLSFCGYSPLNA